jgi:hypothetical protein
VPKRAPFPQLRVSLALLAVLVVAMVLVLLFLPAGSSAPEAAEVAALAALPADGATPTPGREVALGWRATGSRIDTVGGRRALTVRYARGGARATVTVVDASGLEGPTPAGAVVREAGGRTRVVTGTGASRRELGALAAAVGGEGGP